MKTQFRRIALDRGHRVEDVEEFMPYFENQRTLEENLNKLEEVRE